MAIPFLPASLINPTFSLLQMPLVEKAELVQLQKLLRYYKKQWLSRIASEELSIFELNISTNNASESYHSRLNSMIKNSHPRIWTFMSTLNEVIKDTDNDIDRLSRGKEISGQEILIKYSTLINLLPGDFYYLCYSLSPFFSSSVINIITTCITYLIIKCSNNY